MPSQEDVQEALEQGGLFEEAWEWVISRTWEDEWQREMLLQTMLTNQLLVDLNQNVVGVGGGGGAGGYEPPSGGEGSADPYEPPIDSPEYWVTDSPIQVTNKDNYHTADWGFPARTVVLMFDDDIEIAFTAPGNKDNKEIRLPERRSPFSLSGVFGLYAEKLWYRQHKQASSTPELEIIALW